MMKTYNVLLIFLALSLCFLDNIDAQVNFFTTDMEWSKWEKNIPMNIRKEEVLKINDDLMMYLKGNDILDNNLSRFHFLDYDMDGITEIIYSGDAGTTSERTLLFKPDEKGTYIKVFDKFGIVTCIFQPSRIIPPTIILKENTCCGDNNIIYQIYQPINSDGKIELKFASSYSLIKGTFIPKDLINPFLIEVSNKISDLRLKPIVDNTQLNNDLNIKGNAVAEYAIKSKGYVVSMNTDNNGEVWYFVIMINNSKPLNCIIHNSSSNGNSQYFSVGWMSNQYLVKL